VRSEKKVPPKGKNVVVGGGEAREKEKRREGGKG